MAGAVKIMVPNRVSMMLLMMTIMMMTVSSFPRTIGGIILRPSLTPIPLVCDHLSVPLFLPSLSSSHEPKYPKHNRRMNMVSSSSIHPYPYPDSYSRHRSSLYSSSTDVNNEAISVSKINLSNEALLQLKQCGYVSIPNFIPHWLVSSLREDLKNLRGHQRQSQESSDSDDNNGSHMGNDSNVREDKESEVEEKSKFKKAGIGAKRSSANILNEEVRIAETCILSFVKDSGSCYNNDFTNGNLLDDKCPNDARDILRVILENVRVDLEGGTTTNANSGSSSTMRRNIVRLDPLSSELLYVYYPRGGYYRKHIDANRGSTTFLRSYSMLLYLNENWTKDDGGHLRIYTPPTSSLPSSSPSLSPSSSPSSSSSSPKATITIDIEPKGGTLVLFQSQLIQHEVLNTTCERCAVVGWFRRKLSPADIYQKVIM